MKNLAISLSGLILPGTGHILLGRTGRGVVFLVVLSALFFVGVSLERDYYTKFGENNFGLPSQSSDSIHHSAEPAEDEGMLDKVWKWIFTYVYPFLVGIVNYFLGHKWAAVTVPMVLSLPFVENIHEVPVTVRDIGYCFALLAGLLNILIMMDAYDIACNRDELERIDRKEGVG